MKTEVYTRNMDLVKIGDRNRAEDVEALINEIIMLKEELSRVRRKSRARKKSLRQYHKRWVRYQQDKTIVETINGLNGNYGMVDGE